MTDIENFDELPEEEQKKKKKGEDEAGAARGQVTVSPAFFEYMTSVGASKELIAEILRQWQHFKGDTLMRRVWETVKGLVKSSHIQVEIDRNKDYSVVHNFIQAGKNAPAQTLTAQQNNAHKPVHGLDPTMAPRPK